ncbi:hypothetical protein LIER_32341 [Lithospermum erythrorhizon]|uniref:C2 domain-containing protein n=1 Tax=Lithospermum erythrorhizon TaxID=34254 RepID=A0AAV3RTK3_LITER
MAHSQRLLEVTINSAKDLPPISKLLHTFVVAWVNPETKLATRVDQHNNCNPIWNCKLVFRVDDRFLQSELSVVMMEIFNVAWLRDLPMGTTRLMIGQLLKNDSKKNHTMHNIALPIRRSSSGQIQGTLNVSVNVVGGYTTPTATHKPELHIASNTPRSTPTKEKQESLLEKFEKLELICKPLGEKISPMKTSKISFSRSNSMKDTTTDAETSLVDSTMWNQQSELDSKSRAISSNDSLFPTMKHLPSEIASDFKKGCYYQSPENRRTTNIFDNWTDPSATDIKIFRSKSSRWGVDDQVNMFPKEGGEKQMKKNKTANEKGIMSCFGNACGYQCNLFCGSKSEKMKRKNKYESKSPVFRDSEQNLRKLYF